MNKIKFFEYMASQGLGLTYDDVRLQPKSSKHTAKEVSITSYFSRNVSLKVPLVSAAMDTVTESAMAIAMAKAGGLGIIHAGLDPGEQLREVARVKRHLNGLVEIPAVVFQNQTVDEVLKISRDNGFEFQTFPVLDNKNNFVGLITGNDFDFAKKSDVVKNIMTPKTDVFLAKPGTSINQAYKMMLKNKKKTLPLINAKGEVAGLYIFSDVARVMNAHLDKFNLDKNGHLMVGIAVPTDDEAIVRVELMKDFLDVVVIDTAQGDSRFAFDTLKKLKKKFPKLDVVVGNISSGESARLLAQAGADGIKVGQGPGSICTTRVETGIGVPQVTAVYECTRAVEKFNIPICADGGITNPGDVSVAIAAGASSVMMGSKFAGTSETPGEIITLQTGARVKLFRGMGSPSAIRESASSRKRYGDDPSTAPLAEGVESYVPDRGPVSEVVDHYEKALRKGMAYVGAKDINYHQKKTEFIRITGAGLRESHPHDVDVIRT